MWRKFRLKGKLSVQHQVSINFYLWFIWRGVNLQESTNTMGFLGYLHIITRATVIYDIYSHQFWIRLSIIWYFAIYILTSYFEPFLSFSSCPYSTRHSHPDCQYLTVPPSHSSVFKSAKHFGHSFAFDAPKIWNDLPQDVRSATSVASFRKKLKTYLFAKAYPP